MNGGWPLWCPATCPPVDGDTGRSWERLSGPVHRDLYLCCRGSIWGQGRAVPREVPTSGSPDLVRQMIWRGPEPVALNPDYMHWSSHAAPPTGHKGDFGKIFILGQRGLHRRPDSGCPRCGPARAGLWGPREIYPVIAIKCEEAMAFPLPEEYTAILEKAAACDVAVIGPGLGRRSEHRAAGAFPAVRSDHPGGVGRRWHKRPGGTYRCSGQPPRPTVLTPHAGSLPA